MLRRWSKPERIRSPQHNPFRHDDVVAIEARLVADRRLGFVQHPVVAREEQVALGVVADDPEIERVDRLAREQRPRGAPAAGVVDVGVRRVARAPLVDENARRERITTDAACDTPERWSAQPAERAPGSLARRQPRRRRSSSEERRAARSLVRARAQLPALFSRRTASSAARAPRAETTHARAGSATFAFASRRCSTAPAPQRGDVNQPGCDAGTRRTGVRGVSSAPLSWLAIPGSRSPRFKAGHRRRARACWSC